MLTRTYAHHQKRYGPGGVDEHKTQVGVDVFMRATEGCARFLLAGLAWLGQKVLVEERGHVERHRRKAFAREAKPLAGVRIVHLRRASYHPTPTDSTGEPVNWSCRWVVGGHWRNQPCGPKHGDRKLTWIPPFVKGPEGMPLKVAVQKVYAVER